MTRILISNVYSYKNKGDAAIVFALIQELNRVWPNPEIIVQTTDMKNDFDKYGVPATSSLLWILLSSIRNHSLLARILALLSGLFGLGVYVLVYMLTRRKAYFVLTKKLQQFTYENHAADLVVACGGGYLRTASSSISDTLLLYITCLNFVIARYLGKKVYLYSQSIGPVHGPLQKYLLRHALNKVSLIESREKLSFDFLKTLGVQTPFVLTADPALLLHDRGRFPLSQIKLQSGRMYIGVTVRAWFQDSASQNNYINSIAETIDYSIENYNAQVFYVPQVIAEDFGDDDRKVAQAVWAKVKNKEHFTIIDANFHPFDIIGICGKMDIFMGTRMHSNIFALINHVPVIAIEYEYKTRGIMTDFGLEDHVININDVSANKLCNMIDYAVENRDAYLRQIEERLPIIQARSRSAIETIYLSFNQERQAL